MAVGLTPSADHPVNLGMACPKGWEALTPLQADDRATTPLVRDASGRLQPVDWSTALREMCDRFRSVQRRARSRVGGVPVHRSDPDRGDGAARCAGQVRHGDEARRRQHPAVHGHVRRRLQGVVRFRRPALHLRRLRTVRRHRARRLQPLHRPPDHVGAHRPQPQRPRDRGDRSAGDRDRHGGHPAPRAPTQDRPGVAVRPRPSAHRDGSRRPGIRARAHRGLRRLRRTTWPTSPSSGWRPTPGCPSGKIRHLAETHRRRTGRVVLVDHGRQPEPPGGPHRPGDHRPGPDDGQHRPAGDRRQLHHRAVQRHGLAPVLQHLLAARWPRLRPGRAP